MSPPCVVFWFRRDLRLEDNHGLYQALTSGLPVLPIFIFDRNILDELPEKDARVEFIHRELEGMKAALQKIGSDLKCYYGNPAEIYRQLVRSHNIRAVHCNRDYEPYAHDRDREIQEFLDEQGIRFHSYKDHVIFDTGEVLKDDGDPYTVFTPYMRKWYARLESGDGAFKHFPSEEHSENFLKNTPEPMITLSEMGFSPAGISFPPKKVPQQVIKDYKKTRNFPAMEQGTSRLGIHFRFGTISIREKARKSRDLSSTYLNELIWRDFYSQILGHFPRVVNESFRPKYDRIEWRNHQDDFTAWCEGMTGYPIVDAGMRQLKEIGYMHNRVRMITASFLTKHLLTDWRKGEAWFARNLLDYDLASNNGGWQWAAGSGTDAAPYFRIFNPYTQREKFDRGYDYIKKWIPEFGTDNYPEPIVDHTFARERCLDTYKKALS